MEHPKHQIETIPLRKPHKITKIFGSLLLLFKNIKPVTYMHKTYLLCQTVLQSVQYHLNTPSVSIEPTAPCSPHPTATKNNILTPTFIHAPGLGPDLKGVRFPLDGSVCWGVLGRQAWQRVRGGRGCSALTVRGCQGRVHG